MGLSTYLSGQVEKYEEEIAFYTKAMDSLDAFIKTIPPAQSDVNAIQRNAKEKLKDLSMYEKHNLPIDYFTDGMSGTLSSLGLGTIDLAFRALKIMAEAQHLIYWNARNDARAALCLASIGEKTADTIVEIFD